VCRFCVSLRQFFESVAFKLFITWILLCSMTRCDPGDLRVFAHPRNESLSLPYPSATTYRKPSLIRLQLIWMSDNPYRKMKREKHFSQLSIYFKRQMTFRKVDESLVCSDKTLTVSSNLHYYAQKQVKFLCLLSMNKCYMVIL
jgi:hypothetical protein